MECSDGRRYEAHATHVTATANNHTLNTSANTTVLPMSGTQYGNTVGETVKLTSRALEQAHFLHGT